MIRQYYVMEIARFVKGFEEWYPTRFRLEWDKIGLQVGDERRLLRKVLLTLDCTLPMVKQAARERVDLILAHHPLIFSPLKAVHPRDPVGGVVMELVRQDIALYVAHTNLDIARPGVSDALADALGLGVCKVLHPTGVDPLYKLVVFVPDKQVAMVRRAMAAAGAGVIGNYTVCSFAVSGTGTFLGGRGSHPTVGKVGQLEQVTEDRLEMLVPHACLPQVIAGMKGAHPYEEVAYDLYPLANPGKVYGLGRVGVLGKPMASKAFLVRVQSVLKAPLQVVGKLPPRVERVAVCGGSGADFIDDAYAAGAQVYLTADIKHHAALHAKALGLPLIVASHAATEQLIFPRLKQRLVAQWGEQLTVTIATS